MNTDDAPLCPQCKCPLTSDWHYIDTRGNESLYSTHCPACLQVVTLRYALKLIEIGFTIPNKSKEREA